MVDAGFISPESIAWKVHSSPSAFVGGMRSLMVQALQPRAMAAVAQHSEFRVDFWGRLRRTNDYLLTVVYGDRATAERASAVVRSVHSRVSGFDHFSRRQYRADDAELLLWVHNATVESFLHSYRRFGNRLTGAEADQYVAEMQVLGALMGVEADVLPNDEHGLRCYFEDQLGELAASPEAKEAVRILVNPQMPAPLRLVWNTAAADAYASLPREYREMFGLPWVQSLERGVHVGAAVMLTTLSGLLPEPPIIENARRAAALR